MVQFQKEERQRVLKIILGAGGGVPSSASQKSHLPLPLVSTQSTTAMGLVSITSAHRVHARDSWPSVVQVAAVTTVQAPGTWAVGFCGITSVA